MMELQQNPEMSSIIGQSLAVGEDGVVGMGISSCLKQPKNWCHVRYNDFQATGTQETKDSDP